MGRQNYKGAKTEHQPCCGYESWKGFLEWRPRVSCRAVLPFSRFGGKPVFLVAKDFKI